MNFFIAQSAAIHTTVQDWSYRVQKNGGALPSGTTQRALSDFMKGADAYNLTSKMKSVVCFVPDNLIAAITPLVKVVGNDPWTNTNFIASDLTIAGLKGNGSDKYLTTNIKANQLSALPLPVADSHVVVYVSVGAIEAKVEWGGTDAPGSTLSFRLYGHYTTPNVTATQNYGDNTGLNYTQPSAVVPYTGYICSNRISSSVIVGSRDIFLASSTLAHSSSISSATLSTTQPTSTGILVFCGSEGGGASNFSTKRYSFASMGNGLTSIESNNLFNLVQTMRRQLGGGYV